MRSVSEMVSRCFQRGRRRSDGRRPRLPRQAPLCARHVRISPLRSGRIALWTRAMARHYQPREFLRSAPNYLLREYFLRRGVLKEIDWDSSARV